MDLSPQIRTFIVRLFSRAPNPTSEDIKVAKELIKDESPCTEKTRLLNEQTPLKESISPQGNTESGSIDPKANSSKVSRNLFGKVRRSENIV